MTLWLVFKNHVFQVIDNTVAQLQSVINDLRSTDSVSLDIEEAIGQAQSLIRDAAAARNVIYTI